VAAVAYPLAQGPTTSRPRLVVVAGGPARRPCPGRRRASAIYRRRRAVALALLVMGAVVIGLAVPAVLARAGLGGASSTADQPSSIGVLRPAAVHIHVVQPGETLWSIVRATGGSGDPRPAVDRLERQLGGRPLQVGQRLVLP
jgi:hypothetical protein